MKPNSSRQRRRELINGNVDFRCSRAVTSEKIEFLEFLESNSTKYYSRLADEPARYFSISLSCTLLWIL